MIRVLFVCLGNICRSPMAEFIMKDAVEKEGIADRFSISSAGTSDEEEGNPVYPPAREELAKHGISCAGKRARQFCLSDYDKYDFILCMESRHVKSLQRLCGDPQCKISRLLDHSQHPHDIADPWYTRNFALAYAEIEEGVRAFLSEVQKRENRGK